MLAPMVDLVHPRFSLSAPPRSFAALMDLYEMNYLYMRRLVPDGRCVAARDVSVARDGVALHLRVLDRSPYTTTFSLTHRFVRPGGEGEESLPDLAVRVYHDARSAEAFHPPGDLAGREESDLGRRWAANRFLNRWLRFCLGAGHGFGPPAGPPGGTPTVIPT